jgi:hypothetical protein
VPSSLALALRGPQPSGVLKPSAFPSSRSVIIWIYLTRQHPEYGRIAAELIDSAIAFARDTGALTAASYGSFIPVEVQLPSAWTFMPPDFHRVAKTSLYLTLPEDGIPRWPSVRRRNMA